MTNVTLIQPPFLGFDLRSSALRIKDGQGPVVQNFLPGYTGRAPLRGGILTYGQHSASDTYLNGVWPAEVGSEDGLVIAQAGTTVVNFDGSVATPVAAADSSYVPDESFAQVGPHTYGVGRTGVLLRTDGTTITKYANAPSPITAAGYWQNRLFAIGARTLRWSDAIAPGIAVPDTTAAWQDDVSLLDNSIVISDMPSGGCKAMAVVNNQLALFTAQDVWLLRGSAPSNWSIRKALSNRGCDRPKTIVPYNEGVFFADSTGFFYWDGFELTDFSAQIRDLFATPFGLADPATITSACLLDSEYVMVCSSYVFGGSNARPNWAAIMHIPTQSWSTYKTTDISLEQPTYAVRSGHTPFALDMRKVYNASQVPLPGKGGMSEGTEIITATFTSRSLRTGVPGTKGMLRRLIVDHSHSDTISDDGGWTFQVIDVNDDVVLWTSGLVQRKHRYVAEPGVEVDDFKIVATFAGVDVSAELRDIYIEHVPAQRGQSF